MIHPLSPDKENMVRINSEIEDWSFIVVFLLLDDLRVFNLDDFDFIIRCGAEKCSLSASEAPVKPDRWNDSDKCKATRQRERERVDCRAVELKHGPSREFPKNKADRASGEYWG